MPEQAGPSLPSARMLPPPRRVRPSQQGREAVGPSARDPDPTAQCSPIAPRPQGGDTTSPAAGARNFTSPLEGCCGAPGAWPAPSRGARPPQLLARGWWLQPTLSWSNLPALRARGAGAQLSSSALFQGLRLAGARWGAAPAPSGWDRQGLSEGWGVVAYMPAGFSGAFSKGPAPRP